MSELENNPTCLEYIWMYFHIVIIGQITKNLKWYGKLETDAGGTKPKYIDAYIVTCFNVCEGL